MVRQAGIASVKQCSKHSRDKDGVPCMKMCGAKNEIDSTHFRSFIDCFAGATRSRGAAHEKATDCMWTGQRWEGMQR
jgi:hypothetical protein